MNGIEAWATSPFMIGWDSFFPNLESIRKTNATAFPPYNVRKVTDDSFIIELAVAGYNKESLTITQEDCNVIVVGELPEPTEEYLHKGIAGRKFTRTFCLAEHMEVSGVELKDGMLYIGILRNIPEEKKPKSFAINDVVPKELKEKKKNYHYTNNYKSYGK